MPLEQLTLSDEQVQDIVASLITGGGGSDVAYDDTNDTLTVSLSDSISVNTLEATEQSGIPSYATDADAVNDTLYIHTGKNQLRYKDSGGTVRGVDPSELSLANLGSRSHSDLSDAPPSAHHTQTQSSDITVTDTQAGTVSDGEFLKNNGGSLTGGTVQTEPNVPNWEEDSGSPFNLGGGNQPSSVTVNLDKEYDVIKAIIVGESEFSGLFLRFGGVTSSDYDYITHNNNVTGSDKIPFEGFSFGGDTAGKFTCFTISGSDCHGTIDPPITGNSGQFEVDSGTNPTIDNFQLTVDSPETDYIIDLAVEVYGRNLSR